MRPSKDEYFLCQAKLVATRGTCVRRQVGCILVDERGHVLSTGYNGPPAGMEHCIDSPCDGATCPPGEGLDKCEAVHAEQNALLQCPDVYKIHTAYVTTSPCIHCVKLLMNTSCQRIVFLEKYSHSEPKNLWLEADGEWIHIDQNLINI